MGVGDRSGISEQGGKDSTSGRQPSIGGKAPAGWGECLSQGTAWSGVLEHTRDSWCGCQRPIRASRAAMRGDGPSVRNQRPNWMRREPAWERVSGPTAEWGRCLNEGRGKPCLGSHSLRGGAAERERTAQVAHRSSPLRLYLFFHLPKFFLKPSKTCKTIEVFKSSSIHWAPGMCQTTCLVLGREPGCRTDSTVGKTDMKPPLQNVSNGSTWGWGAAWPLTGDQRRGQLRGEGRWVCQVGQDGGGGDDSRPCFSPCLSSSSQVRSEPPRTSTRGLSILGLQGLHPSLRPLGIDGELQGTVSLLCPDPTSAGGSPRPEGSPLCFLCLGPTSFLIGKFCLVFNSNPSCCLYS